MQKKIQSNTQIIVYTAYQNTVQNAKMKQVKKIQHYFDNFSIRKNRNNTQENTKRQEKCK